ncbi:hypothetical protein A9404_02010 [Halothiobacillus diazotrophicus]|uniref:GGDEF domain-containing protein n=1 Tax=Halothiobacillus diazotrophicus TaxID=1860122 RepID=A0A191ZEM9_9GAMM|nr:GGDEF domain-containing protein [Halothiobacillus diazotrophicus]ANJ66315.1 hypothetical protein A9404_02010 [Halothiobacillus diazotrophicus]
MTFRIVAIIATAEFCIMLMFGMAPLPPFMKGTYLAAILDAVLLGLVSAVLIYFWVIRPFATARDSALKRLNHLALTDPLTELANRRLIMRDLAKAIAGNARHKEYGAFLLLDLDGFKAVNDSYGHETGDTVLIVVADRLRRLSRTEDSVGRLGGDEFVVLLHRLGPELPLARERALIIANKIIAEISAPIFHQEHALHVGASIGIRMLGQHDLVSDIIINEADMAMYQAKEQGRGRAFIYDYNAQKPSPGRFQFPHRLPDPAD